MSANVYLVAIALVASLLVADAVLVVHGGAILASSSSAEDVKRVGRANVKALFAQERKVARLHRSKGDATHDSASTTALSSSTRSQTSVAQHVAAARRLWSALPAMPESQRYVMIMQVNGAMAPMVHNWMCNTKHMTGVHERTLIIMSDTAGYRALAGNPYNVTVAEMQLPDRGLAQSQNYGTYGYWKLTAARVQTFNDLISAGIPFLNCEPDAIWLRSPLNDAELAAAATSDDLAISSDIDKAGTRYLAVGFMFVKPNARTEQLFSKLVSTLDNNIRNLGPHALNDDVGGNNLGEQNILEGLLKDGYANATHHALSPCVYASGLWYEPNEDARRRNCILKHGVPVLINNNWIIGNDAKNERSKAWGHWFIGNDRACDTGRVAKAMNGVWPPALA